MHPKSTPWSMVSVWMPLSSDESQVERPLSLISIRSLRFCFRSSLEVGGAEPVPLSYDLSFACLFWSGECSGDALNFIHTRTYIYGFNFYRECGRPSGVCQQGPGIFVCRRSLRHFRLFAKRWLWKNRFRRNSSMEAFLRSQSTFVVPGKRQFPVQTSSKFIFISFKKKEVFFFVCFWSMSGS